MGEKEGKLTRDDRLSASTYSQANGNSPYGSRQELIDRAIRASEGENVRVELDSVAVNLGHFMEGHIIRYACEKLNLRDVKTEFGQKFEHPFFPVECSLDGTAIADDLTYVENPDKGVYIPEGDEIHLDGMGVIECKLTKAYPPQDGKPAIWRGWEQLKTQVECVGCNWGVLVVFYHIQPAIHYYFYQRDPAFEAELKQVAEDFQYRVDTKTYYDPVTSDDAWLKYQKVIPDEVAELPATAINLLAQIERLDENIKASQKARDALQATIMDMMGNAEKAVAGEYEISWGNIRYKAQPEKLVEAKPERIVRRKNINFRRVAT